MGQGKERRAASALTAFALALALAGGAVAAERRAEPRKAVAHVSSAPGPTARKPGAAARKPASRAAPAAAPGTPAAARQPSLRRSVSKGAAAAAPRPAAGPAPAVREAGAQGTVVIRGTCGRLVVGRETYACKGAIYSLHPGGRVSIQFATHFSTIMLAGGGERETEALEFGLTVDQVTVAASGHPTRAYAARGRCTVVMKDKSGEAVRSIACEARGAIPVDADFRSDGGKVDAFYLLTNAGSARGAARD